MYANKTQVASIYLYDWIDYNNDTIIASDEISMINRGVSWGNVQEMRVENPASRFEGTPVVGVFAPPHVYSYWHGVTEENATLINYTITAQYYRHERWKISGLKMACWRFLQKDPHRCAPFFCRIRVKHASSRLSFASVRFCLIVQCSPHSGIADYFAPKDIPDNANLLVYICVLPLMIF